MAAKSQKPLVGETLKKDTRKINSRGPCFGRFVKHLGKYLIFPRKLTSESPEKKWDWKMIQNLYNFPFEMNGPFIQERKFLHSREKIPSFSRGVMTFGVVLMGSEGLPDCHQ